MPYNLEMLILCQILGFGFGIGISSKLDFGDSHPKVIGAPGQYRPPLPVLAQDSKKTGDFETLGVVCVTGGCNATVSNKEATLQADVIVHVKASLDTKNKSTPVDDTPDVPIVVGTDDQHSRALPDQPIIVTNVDEIYHLSPANVQDSSPHNIYVSSHHLNNAPQVDVQIKTAPVPIAALGEMLFNDVKFKSNGVEVPYFERSFHNHYFGENPPQMLWYPKRTGIGDSVDFKGKSLWKPSIWGGSYHRHGADCPCKNQVVGRQWQSRGVYHQTPRVGIDDKLAPLN